MTFPLTPFVLGWMGFHVLTEDRGPQPVDFERAVRYEPAALTAEGLPGEFEKRKRDLLEKFAPIIVQETPKETQYSSEINRLGAPTVRIDDKGKKQVIVDTSRPSVFTFCTEALIQEKPRLQLNYVYWFPEHPSMKGLFDPEAGEIEGLTLRITLGQGDRPIFYETIYNCGCYHRAYPSQGIETAARRQFDLPEKAPFMAVRKKNRFKIDFFVPEEVADLPGERLVIFSKAGSHMPLAIGRESQIADRVDHAEIQTFELRDYGELETGGGDGRGIFLHGGLVAGADRLESTLLIPMGLYHAGTPRRRGTQLIHFDQYDFDDPSLLEKNLRIPSGI